MTKQFKPTAIEAVRIWRHQRLLRIEAQRLEHQAFMAAHPVGSTVHWQKGRYTHSGLVRNNNCFHWSLSLEVRNTKTDKIVRISDYDIVQYLGADQL